MEECVDGVSQEQTLMMSAELALHPGVVFSAMALDLLKKQVHVLHEGW